MKRLFIGLKLTAYAILLHIAIVNRAEPAFAYTITDCTTDLNVENARYVLTGDVTRDCVVTANGVYIDGQELYTITGNIIATSNGGPGFDVTLEDLILSGSIYAHGENSQAGGDITITNSTIFLPDYGMISTKGGDSVGTNGGNGGNITISDSEINLLSDYSYSGANIDAGGGEDEYNEHDGGNGGNITITNSSIGEYIEVRNRGGYGSYGGEGGDLTITGSVLFGNTDSSGGLGQSQGGLAGVVIVNGSTINYGIEANGGTTVENAGVNGGTISIYDSVVNNANISASGGHSLESTGGTGGTITIESTEFNSGNITAIGGRGTYSAAPSYEGDGGLGGEVTITDSELTFVDVNVSGGRTDNSNGGDGGTIEIITSRSFDGGSLIADGGETPSMEGHGGDGGVIKVTESSVEIDGEYGGVFARGGNSYGGEELRGLVGTLILTNLPPDLTVDPDEVTVALGEDYDELEGVTSEDFIDGDLFDEIEISGEVDTSAAGETVVEYVVYDAGLRVRFNEEEEYAEPEFASASRTVTVTGEDDEEDEEDEEMEDDDEEVEEDSRPRSSSGGRGGGLSTSFRNNATLIDQIIEEIKKRVQEMINNGETVPPAILAFLGDYKINTTTTTDLDLEYGDEGGYVSDLQTLLINNGYSIPAGATGSFLEQTKTALAAFQTANNISPALGYFGPATRAMMKSLNWKGLWW